MDASALEVQIDPPAPAGDLKADVESFSTLEACVASKSHLDPLLADTVDAIGYETFVFDGCRTIAAVKARDPKLCASIESSLVKQRCERNVAIAAHKPDLCPLDIPGKLDLGRDAMCLAVAARRPSWCVGAPPVDQVRCDALARASSMRCDRVPFAPSRARCVREVERWRTMIDSGALVDEPAPVVEGSLSVEAASGSDAVSPNSVDLTPQLARGLVLVAKGNEWRTSLGQIRNLGPTPFAPQPAAAIFFGLELTLAATLARIERVELGIPNAVTLVVPGTPSTLKVGVKRLDRQRGGLVKLAIEGEIGSPPRRYKLAGSVSTFVRDITSDL